MAASIKFVIDGAAVQEMLRGPNGPVLRHYIRKADEVIEAARAQIDSKRSGGGYSATGRLQRSIVKRVGQVESGPAITIIAGAGLNPSYAYWVHEGNGPPGGRIFPKRSSVLVFPNMAGGMIFAKSVRTSRPNPYLRDNLKLVLT